MNNPAHWLPSALAVPCPVCGQPVGAICRTPKKALWGRPHTARTKLARTK